MKEILGTNKDLFNSLEKDKKIENKSKDFELFKKYSGGRLKEVDNDLKDIELLKEEINKRDFSENEIKQIKEGLIKIKSAFLKFNKFVFLRLLPVYIAYFTVSEFTEKDSNSFSKKDIAKKELEANGITSEQASTYKLGISELIYRGITPLGYQKDGYVNFNNPNDVLKNEIYGRERKYAKTLMIPTGERALNWITKESPEGNVTEPYLDEESYTHDKKIDSDIFDDYKQSPPNISEIPALEDVFRLYLGLPQEHKTVDISEYKPENSKDDKYYYKLTTFKNGLVEFLTSHRFIEKYNIKNNGNLENNLLEYVRIIKNHPDKKMIVESDVFIRSGDQSKKDKTCDVMENHVISYGKDNKGSYLSYYDRWDLDKNIIEGKKGFFGKPLEFYDRIYFNYETGEILE